MMHKSKIKNRLPEPQPNSSTNAGELPSAQVLPNPMLGDAYLSVLETFRYKEKSFSPEWINDFFVIENNIYSTNRNVLVWVDKGLIQKLPAYQILEYSKLSTLLPVIENINKVISIEEINNTLSKCETEDAYDWYGSDITCNECNGEGDVEWEYKSYSKEFNCPKCDGDGLSSKRHKRKNGKKIIAEFSTIKVGNSYLCANKFKQFVDVAILLGEKNITLVSQEGERKANVFKIGNMNLILMPLTKPYNDDQVVPSIA